MLLARRTTCIQGSAFALAFFAALAAHAQETAGVATENDVGGGPDAPGATTSPQAPSGPADTQAQPGKSTKPEAAEAEQPAKRVKQAEPTPIVASPQGATKPAYQLFTQTDLPVLGIGLVLAGSRLVRTQAAYCAPLCDRNDVNAFDRTTAGFWNTGWSTASDVGVYSLIGGAAIVLAIDESPWPALNDAVVIAESALMATGFSAVLGLAAGRPRPFLYGTKAPLDERNSASGGLSFTSSHASVSFALVMSMFMTEQRLHPGEAFPYIVLGAGLAVASFVATARVMAGRHFITDAIGGAVIGTSAGVLVPALHGSPVKVVPTVTPEAGAVSVVGMF
jgi:membrane-associated phospholipid phosphatase